MKYTDEQNMIDQLEFHVDKAYHQGFYIGLCLGVVCMLMVLGVVYLAVHYDWGVQYIQ